MEVAIRWSPLSTPSDARFLIADVIGRTFKHCRATNCSLSLQWEEISRITKVPIFRAFDWSPSHDIVAIGQWSGETTVLDLKTGSSVLSLPIKSQRQCNAVSFNPSGLLATGLERVRNDFCLSIYDTNHCVSRHTHHGLGSKQFVEPVRKLATSEGITSIKFFAQQPNTLVAGVKGTCVRIYDLREDTSNPVRQYQTACVHNIAIDPTDENYFASAAPLKDTTVLVWDRRSMVRPISGSSGISTPQEKPILELKTPLEVKDKTDQASIWSLRFSSTEPGCLGILESSGHFRIHNLKKDYILDQKSYTKEGSSEEVPQDYVQQLYLNATYSVERPYRLRRPKTQGRDAEEIGPIVSFDFTNVFTPNQRPCAIILRGNQDIDIIELRGRPLALAISPLSTLAMSRPRRNTSSSKSSKASTNGIAGLIIKQPSRAVTISKSLMSIRKKHSIHKGEGLHFSKISIVDALVFSVAARRRCLEGYLFDCNRNQDIVKDNSELQEMWKWIAVAQDKSMKGKMVSGKIDFSYLGVHGLWNQDLGQVETRVQQQSIADLSIGHAITTFAQSLEWPTETLPQTAKAEQRMVCLYTIGLSPKSEDLLNTIENLASSGDNAQGCLVALMFNDRELAFKALQSGPRKDDDIHHRLSMAITAFSLIEDSDIRGEQRTRSLQRIEQSLGNLKGPYAEVVAKFVTTGLWSEVLTSKSLPLKLKLAIALLSLPDNDLSTYINQETHLATSCGNVQGIVLTGLSNSAIDLFQSYLDLTSDVQTAVLAMSFSAPRFVHDRRFDAWRHAYRSQLNTWGLYIERTRFDMQSTKLSVTWDGTRTLQPLRAQISLRCNKCSEALHRDLPQPDTQSASTTTSGRRSQTPNRNVSIFGDSKSGTVCPKCNAHLPRCVICDLWLGVPDPRSKGARGEGGKDPFSQHLEVCLKCRHMYHRGHAQEWFRGHEKCAVPDCECRCNALDR